MAAPQKYFYIRSNHSNLVLNENHELTRKNGSVSQLWFFERPAVNAPGGRARWLSNCLTASMEYIQTNNQSKPVPKKTLSIDGEILSQPRETELAEEDDQQIGLDALCLVSRSHSDGSKDPQSLTFWRYENQRLITRNTTPTFVLCAPASKALGRKATIVPIDEIPQDETLVQFQLRYVIPKVFEIHSYNHMALKAQQNQSVVQLGKKGSDSCLFYHDDSSGTIRHFNTNCYLHVLESQDDPKLILSSDMGTKWEMMHDGRIVTCEKNRYILNVSETSIRVSEFVSDEEVKEEQIFTVSWVTPCKFQTETPELDESIDVEKKELDNDENVENNKENDENDNDENVEKNKENDENVQKKKEDDENVENNEEKTLESNENEKQDEKENEGKDENADLEASKEESNEKQSTEENTPKTNEDSQKEDTPTDNDNKNEQPENSNKTDIENDQDIKQPSDAETSQEPGKEESNEKQETSEEPTSDANQETSKENSQDEPTEKPQEEKDDLKTETSNEQDASKDDTPKKTEIGDSQKDNDKSSKEEKVDDAQEGTEASKEDQPEASNEESKTENNPPKETGESKGKNEVTKDEEGEKEGSKESKEEPTQDGNIDASKEQTEVSKEDQPEASNEESKNDPQNEELQSSENPSKEESKTERPEKTENSNEPEPSKDETQKDQTSTENVDSKQESVDKSAIEITQDSNLEAANTHPTPSKEKELLEDNNTVSDNPNPSIPVSTDESSNPTQAEVVKEPRESK